MDTGSDTRFGYLLAALACAAAALIALRAPGLGDYPRDAGPALAAAAHGNAAGFLAHQPAMGAFALYLRVPFAALAVTLGDGGVGIYRWGSLPCLIALALAALWLARFAGRRGTGRLGQALIVAVCLLNPMIDDALYYGHPEEILTASLVAGAILAAIEQRRLASILLTGLAIASKQWALVIVIPVVLILERDRPRAAIAALGIAALSTLPMAAGNFTAFHHAWSYIAKSQPMVTLFTWLYPLSATGTGRITDVTGESHPFVGHLVWPIESTLSHPLIILAGIAVPPLVWFRSRRDDSARLLLLATALVLLLRCSLDPETSAYYHLPLLLVLLALDAAGGRRLPLLGLSGAAVSFVVLDRFPSYLGPGPANVAYIVATALGAVLLAHALMSASRSTNETRHPADNSNVTLDIHTATVSSRLEQTW